jgi:hypothetical protein
LIGVGVAAIVSVSVEVAIGSRAVIAWIRHVRPLSVFDEIDHSCPHHIKP